MKLAEAIQEISETIEERLEENKDNLGVENVKFGEAIKPSPRPPALILYIDELQVDDPKVSLEENWVLPVVLVSVVQDSKNPKEGQNKAIEIASNARSFLLKDKFQDLGLDIVSDVRSTRFKARANYSLSDRGGLYSSAALVEVRFSILEPY